MTQFKPQFKTGVVLHNEQTNERYVICTEKYDKDKCDITYKVQKQRYRFDMFWITETQILENLENGSYKQIEK